MQKLKEYVNLDRVIHKKLNNYIKWTIFLNNILDNFDTKLILIMVCKTKGKKW